MWRPKLETTAQRRRYLIISYGIDWLITLALLVIFACIDRIEGYKRDFSLDDRSIQHPVADPERVPFYAAVLIAGIFPIICIILSGTFWARSFYDAHQGLLGFALTIAITLVITDVTKLTVGRPRPDMLSRCQPAADATMPQYGLVTAAICTTTDMSLLNDGFKSFFSGHSSFSFAGLGYLSLYVGGKIHLFDRRGHTAKAWLCICPLVAAALIAISRTMDYRHHATDVLIGGLVGFWTAAFSYHLYYPFLWDAQCHKPFSPRISLHREGGDLEARGRDGSDVELRHSTDSTQHNTNGHLQGGRVSESAPFASNGGAQRVAK